MIKLHFDTYQALEAALELPAAMPGAFRFNKLWHGSSFTCASCKQSVPFPIDPSGAYTCGTGYGVTGPAGQESMICFACCGKADESEMLQTGKATLYISGRTVTNWPGTLKLPATHVRTNRHSGGFGSQRKDVWFTGPDGKQWHGINRGDNDILRCKRLKTDSKGRPQ